MSPLGALATSLALEDVEDLFNSLRDNSSIPEAVESYNQTSVPRAKKYRAFSHQRLISTITDHGPDEYKKRMNQIETSHPGKVLEPLINLTQDSIDENTHISKRMSHEPTL